MIEGIESKDVLTVLISTLALALSVLSFVISLRQRKRENSRALRKQLSDTLNDISEVSVAMAELRYEVGNNLSNEIIDLRRSYNTQKRTLLHHAEFLINENSKITTDVDYMVMAINWNIIGNYPKAETYYKLGIEKADDLVIRHLNLRSYASFLFMQGNMPLGRNKYKEALELRLPDTENVKRTVADTYLMWARVEREFKFYSEAAILLALAKNSCERISHTRMKKEVENQIELFSLEDS